jgi:glycosyltransferase involved in cell wall biosynthesis
MLLPDRDVDTAAASVRRLLDSDEERARLRARGTALASEHGFDRVVAELEDLYRRLCRAR